jgi:hypothetical protein
VTYEVLWRALIAAFIVYAVKFCAALAAMLLCLRAHNVGSIWDLQRTREAWMAMPKDEFYVKVLRPNVPRVLRWLLWKP